MKKWVVFFVVIIGAVYPSFAQNTKIDLSIYGNVPDAVPNDEKSMLEWARQIPSGSARLNSVDGPWPSPLYKAVYFEYPDVVKVLLDKGSKVQVIGNGGYPLQIAAQKGNQKIAELLISKGADVNLINDGTPLLEGALHHAAREGRLEFVEFLLKKGANPKNGGPVLDWPSKKGYLEIVKLLINSGADVKTKNYLGRSCLHNAALGGNYEIADLLIKNGADVNLAAGDGATPLYEAVIGGDLKVVELLVSKGADVNAAATYGRTALWRAKTEKHKEIEDFLVKMGAK